MKNEKKFNLFFIISYGNDFTNRAKFAIHD